MAETTKRGGSPIVEEAAGVANAMKNKAGEMATAAGEMAGQAKNKAQEWAGTAAGRAEDAKRAVGEGLESLGDKLREKAPHTGMMGTAAGTVADKLENAGLYLQTSSFEDMGREVTGLIRRYPFQALLVGVGVGFLLARATRS